MKEKYDVYIYGAGNMYNRLVNSFNQHAAVLNILGIITSSSIPYKRIDGYDCLTVEEADFKRADFVIIAVEKWKEIFDILLGKGVCEEKIIRGNIFEIPNFDFKEYLELKASNVSILSNYCLGGMLYKKLGLKMNSPTIDMYCGGKGYLKFVENYQYYLRCEMKKLEWENYVDGMQCREAFYYKGILNDEIIWNFNHSSNIDKTIAEWNMRKERFNFTNVAVIMTIQSDDDAYSFEELKIEKRIGIYYKNLNLPHIVCIPEWKNNSKLRLQYDGMWTCYVNDYMTSRGGLPINWVKFLLGCESYYRKVMR